MRGRLIEPLERWTLDWPWLLLGAALLWRLLAGVLLWGGARGLPPDPFSLQGLAALWPPPGLLERQLIAVLLAASLLLLVRSLAPREYSAAAGLLAGGLAAALAIAMLPRAGLLLTWVDPDGLAPHWYILCGGLLLLSLGLQLRRMARWQGELRGHGIEWTKQWARDKPYAARKLALKALRFMGDWEVQ